MVSNTSHRDFHHTSSIAFDVEFFNNFGDGYAVIAFADAYMQAGFHPVKVSRVVPQVVDVMLLPQDSRYNFADAT
jgi:hypothetical protein